MSAPKSDLETLGVFSQPGYISNDKYTNPNYKPFVEAHFKGKQLVTGCTKKGHDTPDVYLDKQFARVFQGEGYSDPVASARRKRVDAMKLQIVKTPFRPSGVPPKPSGKGDHFGTFSGPIQAMSVISRRPVYKPPGKNFLVSPIKKGSGFGYAHLGIGEDPVYSSEPYNAAQTLTKEEMKRHKAKMIGKAFIPSSGGAGLFSPNVYTNTKPLPPPKREAATPPALQKQPFRPSHPAKSGLNGGLNPYPTHSSDGPPKKAPPKAKGKTKVFLMNGGPKSAPTKSVLQANVPRRVTAYKVSSFGR
eukprot:Nk52_evm19s232 gene=Nk52_evmTU19s232